MERALRSSEFWVAVFTALGVGGAQAGVWSQVDFNQLVAPALVYVAGRIISKMAKSVGTNGKPGA